METAIEVQFNGLERSEAIEAHVEEKVAKLKKRFERMTSARVVIEVPHRNPARATKSKIYTVKLEIAIPSQKPILVTHERDDDHTHDDILLAIRDAFDAAERQAKVLNRKLAAPAKHERSRRRPAKPADQD
jgi:ribosomal subunit interface protein